MKAKLSLLLGLIVLLTGCVSGQTGSSSAASTGGAGDSGALAALLRGARRETERWGEGSDAHDVTLYHLNPARRDELFQAVREAGFVQTWYGEWARDWDLGSGVLLWSVSPDIERWDNEIWFSPVRETTVHNYRFRPLSLDLGGNATATGGTITLTADTRLERDFDVQSGYTLVVPAGVTLDLTADGARLCLRDGATLTVNGTVNARGHADYIGSGISIEPGASVINGGGTINLKGKGPLLNIWSGDGNKRHLTLDGVTLVGVADNSGSLVHASNGSELVLKSGAITGNTNVNNDWAVGGGISLNRATFTMTGGTISGNTARGGRGSAGGGVNIGEGSVFTMTGGAISGNTASGREGNGGGMGVSGTFIMEGGTISGNFAQADGGGISVLDDGTFTMKGGTISGNITGPSPGGAAGGGVMVNRGTFTMEGGTISGNTAVDEGGGGVGVYSMGTFIMKGGTVYGRADRLPTGTDDASLANNAPAGAALLAGRGAATWGTGGTYTRGGAAQAGGTNIGNTNDTLIAVPAR